MDTSLDIIRALKVSIGGLPWTFSIVIPGYAPWKQISSVTTVASTQHGNTLRIENIGSTSWKLLRSSSGHVQVDDDEFLDTVYSMNLVYAPNM